MAKVCNCPKNLELVCGKDGNTYGNECLAECAGIKDTTEVDCAPSKAFACHGIYKPLCGSDGITYTSQCEADLVGMTDTTCGE